MNSMKKSLLNASKVALISIHPKYADKIVSGEKRFEFRPGWTRNAVDYLVVYSTNPLKKIVAITEVGTTFKGNKTELWELDLDGGVTQEGLFEYMDRKEHGVVIELINMHRLGYGIAPTSVLGENFRAPQSFRYLDKNEISAIYDKVGELAWV